MSFSQGAVMRSERSQLVLAPGKGGCQARPSFVVASCSTEGAWDKGDHGVV